MATCIVTFNYKGGTGSPATAEVTVGAAYGTLPSPTKAGNEFGGWYSADTHGSLVTASTTVTAETDHTLFARWIPERLTVRFDVPQGAVVTPSSKIVEKTFRYGWLPTPTRTGYVFVKWNTAADGHGTDINSESIVPVDNPPTTLYAVWRPATYNVTFDTNGGFTLPEEIRVRSYTYGQKYGVLGSPILYTHVDWEWRAWGPRVPFHGTYNYGEVTWAALAATTFLGWFDHPTEGRQYTEDEVCYLDHDTVFFAHWDWSRLKSVVQFDPVGGKIGDSTEIAEREYILTDAITSFPFGSLPKPTPPYPGVGFLGWFNKPNDELVYDDECRYGPYTMAWTEGWLCADLGREYLNPIEAVKITAGYRMPWQYNQIVVYHQDTETWFKAMTSNDDFRLFANWLTYDVILDHQGGRSTSSKVKAMYGGLLPTATNDHNYQKPPVPTRTGYVFAGYFEKPGGKGLKFYKPGEGVCVPVARWNRKGGGTIYAHWTREEGGEDENAITVEFHCDHGLTFTSKRVVPGNQYGAFPKLIEYDITDRAYSITRFQRIVFDEWDDPVERIDVKPTDICDQTSDVWIQVYTTNAEFRLTLVTNGGTINSGGRTSYHPNFETEKTLPTNVTRPGYTFGGWYVSPTFSGSAVTRITGIGDKVYYAKWIPAAYTISFNANGGSVSPSSKSVEANGYVGALPTPTRTGWIFDGWFTAATGGSRVIAEDRFTGTASMTLYAHWSAVPTPPDPGHALWGYVKYKIELVLNGGELVDSSYEQKYMVGFSKSLPTEDQVAKTGCTFDGWYASEDLSGSPVDAIPNTATGTKTYYAKWV